MGMLSTGDRKKCLGAVFPPHTVIPRQTNWFA
jgi:hypothetical protein